MYQIHPDLKALSTPITKCTPDPNNARTGHDLEGQAASLKKYGQRKPIVVNKETGIIEAGNGLYAAAKHLGWKNIAALFVEDDPKTATGFAIADNRLSDKSVFDAEKLASLFNIVSPDEIPGVDDNFLASIGYLESNLINDDEDTPKRKGQITPKGQPSKEIPLKTDENNTDEIEWIKSFKEIYIQFSGGKDSMATVACLLDNNVDRNKISLIFSNTPLDYPDLSDSVKAFAEKEKLKLFQVGKNLNYEDTKDIFRRNGFPLQYMRWCTSSWKIMPMKNFLKEKGLIGREDVVMVQGWRAEESKRRANSLRRYINPANQLKSVRPILDWKKEKVLTTIEDHGWKLHYSYNYRDRLGCIFCFSTTKEEWDSIRTHDPDMFLRAMDLTVCGSSSKNIKPEEFRNRIRKMFGQETFEKEHKLKNADQYEEPEEYEIIE